MTPHVHTARRKTLLVVNPFIDRLESPEQHALEAADRSPRQSFLEDELGADVLDGARLRALVARSWLLRVVARVAPVSVVQALAAFRARKRYDVIVGWDDRFILAYSLLARAGRQGARHVAVVTWMATPRKAGLLRLAGNRVDRIILWSEVQRDVLIHRFGFDAEKIRYVPYFVDDEFWRPLNRDAAGICAVGDSHRDYGTLIEAMDGLDVSCRIATRVRPDAKLRGDWADTARSLAGKALPDNVTLGAASVVELRDLYARSRFVVLPLLPGLRDSGITVVTQAMAMGKALICSRIEGLQEFVDDGVNAMFVDPCDAKALRAAIEYLLTHPDVAERLGAAGRERAVKVHAMSTFVRKTCEVVDEVA